MFISYYGQPAAKEIHNGSKNVRFKQLPFNVIFSLKSTEGERVKEWREGGREGERECEGEERKRERETEREKEGKRERKERREVNIGS